ncbi:MAG: pyridoxamine 5'-phosphate oxidase family protein [Acidobacteriota bacterium]|nr:MAG: pyridoxamine 5'-phosphate oxidase family protein [Acidobacteriota bacterium]
MSNDGPIADRPEISGYGIPKGKKGLLPWSHVSDRLEKALHYWVCTVGPQGEPHATPVDGLWIDGELYFGGSPTTRRNRNLSKNPAVCVHLESGSDVVILQGEAHELKNPERSLTTMLSEESKKKYGYGPAPEDYEKLAGVYIFRPRKVLAWSNFPKDATRWRLPESV